MLPTTPGGGGGGGEGEAGSSTDPLLHHHHQQQQQHHRLKQEGTQVGTSFQKTLGSIAITTADDNSSDDPNKKIRKPYTITKSRESWSEQEHDKFLEALQLFDRDWKKIEAFVGSKTVIQIRSHAQKYFLKVQKNGTSEHVPPPRPKRKAAHPYPQKASKSGNSLKFDTPLVIRNSTCGSISSWDTVSVKPVDVSYTRKEEAGPSVKLLNNSCSSSSTETLGRTSQNSVTADQGHHATAIRAMPDFAQVYNFIGSLFDANKSGHLEKLKEMDPIDVETVLLLMKNLSINLKNPDFEGHRKVLI